MLLHLCNGSSSWLLAALVDASVAEHPHSIHGDADTVPKAHNDRLRPVLGSDRPLTTTEVLHVARLPAVADAAAYKAMSNEEFGAAHVGTAHLYISLSDHIDFAGSCTLQEDVARLPAEADAAAYEAMPIEEFGAAMMRGMGWTEGQGVGRRKSGPAKPFQYVQRPHRLGLGAEPAKPEVHP